MNGILLSSSFSLYCRFLKGVALAREVGVVGVELGFRLELGRKPARDLGDYTRFLVPLAAL